MLQQPPQYADSSTTALDPAALVMGKHVGANQITDADHAGAKDRRSISGYAIMLSGAMVMWTSNRQPVTAISSTEREFYSVCQPLLGQPASPVTLTLL